MRWCGERFGSGRHMTRPRLLDLFCCEGGAAMGYHRAGFDIIGIDNKPQPRYPFEFIQADALNPPVDLTQFDAIHASPPCQHDSIATRATGNPDDHPDLLGPTRDMLNAAGVLYVIENVEGAAHRGKIRRDVTLCGSMFGMQVRRHRVFELGGWFTMQHGCTGHDWRPGELVDVTGGASGPNRWFRHKNGKTIKYRNADHAREVMGMPWASGRGCVEAIPPAYTEWIGTQLLDAILPQPDAGSGSDGD